MRFPKKVNEKAMNQLRKKVKRVDKIHEMIAKLESELVEINSEVRWVRYCSKEMVEGLTQEENWELAELSDKIIYCCERR
jgi:uncharacterized protein (UPF0335 family)